MIRQPDARFKAQHPFGAPHLEALHPVGDPQHLAAAEALIERARQHPLGTHFLKDGAPDAVAATFEVHAFTVDQARDLLGRRASPRPSGR